ncbi:MAG: GNAT family N-acetyltransferase [Lachnospiraceae bacterium]|nr:GNAT family N-acetyltransferase [Lachnospiraceae bacterium]
MTIRKAVDNDIDAIVNIYDKIHTAEEKGEMTIGWMRNIYPVCETAENALTKGELFTLLLKQESGTERIAASAIINQKQLPAYALADWHYQANDSEIMVLHTLTIDPDLKCRNLGSRFVSFYEQYALLHDCHYLRIDTQEKNENARRFYDKLGYQTASIVSCDFNGIKKISTCAVGLPRQSNPPQTFAKPPASRA